MQLACRHISMKALHLRHARCYRPVSTGLDEGLLTDRKWIIVTQLSASRIENTYGFLGRSQGMDEASIKNSFAEYRKTVTTRQS